MKEDIFELIKQKPDSKLNLKTVSCEKCFSSKIKILETNYDPYYD